MGERESKAAKVIKILNDEEMEGMRTVGRVSVTLISYSNFDFHFVLRRLPFKLLGLSFRGFHQSVDTSQNR